MFLVICLFFLPFKVFGESVNDIKRPVNDYSSGSYNSNYSSSSMDDDNYRTMSIAIIIILFFGVSFICEAGKKKEREKSDRKFIGDCDELVKKYFGDLDEEKLLNILTEKFLEVQKARMEFDYDTLKKDCTKELYQMYKNDLEILKTRKQKKIIDHVKKGVSNIKSIEEQNGTIIVEMYLRIDFNNYIIDTETEEVVSGNKSEKVVNQYYLQFVKSKKLVDKCPNCNSSLNKKNICNHCKTYVDVGYDDLVLSSKKKI